MRYVAGLIVLQIFLLASGACLADEQKAKAPPKKRAKIVHRLPNNFGKVGLSQKQKEKIYEVQDTYREKITELLNELESLRSQQNLEIQNVLTDEQKKELSALLSASKKKRELAKSKRELSKKKAKEAGK